MVQPSQRILDQVAMWLYCTTTLTVLRGEFIYIYIYIYIYLDFKRIKLIFLDLKAPI